MKKSNNKPIKLITWGKDWYSLGIFCAKVRIVDYARQNMKSLSEPGEKKELFDAGIRDAENALLSDVAFTAGKLRHKSDPRLFDAFIESHAGRQIADELSEAIAEARDWESENQKAAAKEIMDTMFAATGNSRERQQRPSTFGEGYTLCEVSA